jgi:hypothetical protein
VNLFIIAIDVLKIFVGWIPFDWVLSLFRNKKYKTDETHEYFKTMRQMESQFFSQLEKEMDVSRVIVFKTFFVDYMIVAFIQWGMDLLRHLEKYKELPVITPQTVWGVIYDYRMRAIYDWEKTWEGNRAMRIVVEKIDAHRKGIIDTDAHDIGDIAEKVLDPDTALDLIFSRLTRTFTCSFFNIRDMIKNLNGELTAPLEEWKNIQIKTILTNKKK